MPRRSLNIELYNCVLSRNVDGGCVNNGLGKMRGWQSYIYNKINSKI